MNKGLNKWIKEYINKGSNERIGLNQWMNEQMNEWLKSNQV